MNISMRKCTVDDVETLKALSIKTYYETFISLTTAEDMDAYLTEAYDIQKLKKELSDTNIEFYFMYCENELAGYIKLNEAPSQSDLNDTDSLELERIYVASEFQGRGLGNFLMNTAVTKALEKQKSYLFLGVWEMNEKALAFYKKHGFYEIGTHKFVMGEDVQTDYIMRKDL